ncbi:hypothetical protein L484_010349 [Morus notabilis]|uniref:Uncharacterized protein n=1 Tax=Morus notabilis TaxID=981085 RepID=W9RWJ3_9ROSA|nr:hypothetical protein L484_010349 [Morus notabilis]
MPLALSCTRRQPSLARRHTSADQQLVSDLIFLPDLALVTGEEIHRRSPSPLGDRRPHSIGRPCKASSVRRNYKEILPMRPCRLR